MKKLLLFICLLLACSPGAFAQKLFTKIDKADAAGIKAYFKSEVKAADLFTDKSAESGDSVVTSTFSVIEWSAVKNCLPCMQEFISNAKKMEGMLDLKEELSKSVAHSVRNDNMTMLDLLVKNGADINHLCETCHGQAPIQVALTYNNYGMFFRLLQGGANPGVENFRKQNLLHTLTASYEDTKTHSIPGIKATASSDIAMMIVDTLLRYKTDINAKDLRNQTPMIFAAGTNNPQLYDYLRSKGGKINKHNKKEMLTVLNNAMYYLPGDGSTTENRNMFDKILKEEEIVLSYDLTAIDDLDGTYLLINAARAINEKVFTAIIDLKPNVDQVNFTGECALDWAVINGDVSIATKLLDAQAKVSKLNMTEAKKIFKGNKELIKKFEEGYKARPVEE